MELETIAEAGDAYRQRGWVVVPLARGQKNPYAEGWRERDADELAQLLRPEGNIGIILGERSGDLVDVDLDCPEAVAAADHLLRSTGLVSGRKGRPSSHRFYRCTPLPARNFSAVSPEGESLVELRVNGCTMVAPSMHPTGERVAWELADEPRHLPSDELLRGVQRVAAAALLAKVEPGTRHQAMLSLSGWLAKSGWSEVEAVTFVEAVLAASGDEEADDRLRAVRDTYNAHRAGEAVRGYSGIMSLMGERAAQRLGEWLDLASPRLGRAVTGPTPKILRISDLRRLPKPRWLVEGVLPEKGIALLLGNPGAGKSFVALDLALRIAADRGWSDREVLDGNTLFVAGEGTAGLPVRVHAWESFHDLNLAEGGGFGWSDKPLNLLHPAAVELWCGVVAEERPRLIVLDTLSRCIPGADENMAMTMSKVVGSIDQLREASGGAVLLLHHTPKHRNDSRGSSALPAAADAIWMVNRSSGGQMTLKCDKMKDGEDGTVIGLTLQRYRESCVVVVNGELPSKPFLNEREEDLLRRISEVGGRLETSVLIEEGWAQSSLHRAASTLLDAGLIVRPRGLLILTEEGENSFRGEIPICPTPHRGGTWESREVAP